TIARCAERAGRYPAAITLVAVTKTLPAARIREAIGLGLKTFGENRVQEALPKIEVIGTADASWHLIGHLQTNKVKFIEGRFAMVQSIDRVAVVEALDRRLGSPLEILIEVNLAEEPQKTGALPADRHQFPPHVRPGSDLPVYLRHLRAGRRLLVRARLPRTDDGVPV